jgi:8-oxo-dGTP pyrophosphatase MutT (NUDIX family)
MATSRFQSEQYFSDALVESAGAVLFHLSTKQICLVRLLAHNEYLLAKGRRNLGETRQAAALRELTEETGHSCRICPVSMVTRNPPAIEVENVPDEPRFHNDAREPFALQIRHIAEGNIKLIWWYIAAVDEDVEFNAETQENDKFAVELFGYKEAVEKLTYQMDREIAQKAIDIMKNTNQIV